MYFNKCAGSKYKTNVCYITRTEGKFKNALVLKDLISVLMGSRVVNCL